MDLPTGQAPSPLDLPRVATYVAPTSSRAAPLRLLARQVPQRVDRLAVVADLEVEHVARRAGAAEFGDLLPGLDHRPLVDQPVAVVAVGRQPLLVVLDDDQFAVADQSGPRIHHRAVARRAHRGAAAAGDVDALF